jgi:hypothetical protein
VDLNEIRGSYLSENYSLLDASSKACQSKDKRRATRDFDFDLRHRLLSPLVPKNDTKI